MCPIPKLSGLLTKAGPVISGVVLCLFMLAAPVVSYPENPHIQEYEVKAAFLFNFARLTGWPQGAFAQHEKNFVIGILGEDPFGKGLELLRYRSIDGRSVLITRIDDIRESSDCNLLFIASSEMDRLPEIIAQIGNRPVLTVSDIKGFENKGGTIAFFLKDNRVRFRINIDAARKARLEISSHLLEVADIVRENGR